MLIKNYSFDWENLWRKLNLGAYALLQDINSITVSPNDKLLATGSQDKTARVGRL